MKLFESIKNYFAPGYDKRLIKPVEDARILSAIGKDSTYLTASNGFRYYYYFTQDEKDTSVAKFLMRRNGVKVKTHTSKYYYVPKVCLRIRTVELNKLPKAKLFVESIDSSLPFSDAEELQQKIAIVRNQMKGKVR